VKEEQPSSKQQFKIIRVFRAIRVMREVIHVVNRVKDAKIVVAKDAKSVVAKDAENAGPKLSAISQSANYSCLLSRSSR
jgi:hypothetical protein